MYSLISAFYAAERTGNLPQEIQSLDLTSGQLQRIDAEVAGIPILWAADIIFTIRYKANSHGERWAYPGGALVDNI
jgi:hypothetical protein